MAVTFALECQRSGTSRKFDIIIIFGLVSSGFGFVQFRRGGFNSICTVMTLLVAQWMDGSDLDWDFSFGSAEWVGESD